MAEEIDELEDGEAEDDGSLTREEAREVANEINVIDLAPCSHYVSTGCTLLDLAISNQYPGGFGAGRISQIYGGESTAKTVLMMECLGSIQRQGGPAILSDAEHTFDFGRAPIFGIDTGKKDQWMYNNPQNLEELFDKFLAEICKERIKKNVTIPALYGVDSLSALPSATEEKEVLGSGMVANVSRAKILSAAFRKYIWKINRANIGLIFIDQVRDNVGVIFGDPEVTTGGRALKFYASTRLKLNHAGKILNSRGVEIGVEIKAKVTKNKIAPPFRGCKFRIIFDYGICDISTNLEWLREWDLDEYKDFQKGKGEDKEETKARRSRMPYLFGGHKEKSLDSMVKFIEDNDLETTLQERVVAVWRSLYAMEPRKAKKRWENTKLSSP